MVTDLPSPGLGTWQNDDPAQCAETVETALAVGYRHVDTAQGYDNEAAVGRGLADADVAREAVFVATKVSTDNLAHDDVLESARASAERLGVETIDLLYVHWPLRTYDPAGTLAAFDELRAAGTIRHVGLSNFEPDQLDAARERLDAPVAAHQVEFHPLLQQERLLDYAERHDHRLVAYSPLARGAALDEPSVQAVAEERDATPAQVCLAWIRAKGAVPIPKATGDAHLRENWAAQAVDLRPADIERIDAIEREERVVDFEAAPWNR